MIRFRWSFLLKSVRIGLSSNKAYLALFVCFASKAVQLELVSDLTTNACIAALRRLTSRRGCPRKLYSDNATNFTGSQSALEKLLKILNAKYQDSQRLVFN